MLFIGIVWISSQLTSSHTQLNEKTANADTQFHSDQCSSYRALCVCKRATQFRYACAFINMFPITQKAKTKLQQHTEFWFIGIWRHNRELWMISAHRESSLLDRALCGHIFTENLSHSFNEDTSFVVGILIIHNLCGLEKNRVRLVVCLNFNIDEISIATLLLPNKLHPLKRKTFAK